MLAELLNWIRPPRRSRIVDSLYGRGPKVELPNAPRRGPLPPNNRVHTHTAYCFEPSCMKVHHVHADEKDWYWGDWREKHKNCVACGILPASFIRTDEFRGLLSFNTDIKEAFQTEQSLTVTNLHSLASSATAGWGGDSIDNTSNLYSNALVMVHIAAVNTAPGSDQAIYLFAFAGTDGAIWTSTGTSGGTVGTQGTLTFPSVATLPCVMPRLGVLPYPVQNKALDGGAYAVASCFGGVLPPYWGVALINYSGFTFAASGNTIKYRGQYYTG